VRTKYAVISDATAGGAGSSPAPGLLLCHLSYEESEMVEPLACLELASRADESVARTVRRLERVDE